MPAPCIRLRALGITPAKALSAALLLAAGASTSAGWYRVTNYEGQVGASPVHVSLQRYESFGSGLNVMGSYYRDAQRDAVPLYGKADAQGGMSLCEIRSARELDDVVVRGSVAPIDTSACPLRLLPTEGGARGTWTHAGRSDSVVLTRIGTLDDTQGLAVTGSMEIPFWGQTADHLFIGSYASPMEPAGTTVRVVDKRTGRTVQQLLPGARGCVFGFFMTPIYMNVERHPPGGSSEVLFNCYSTGPGDASLHYGINRATKRFALVRR